jgi:hypothetical protein
MLNASWNGMPKIEICEEGYTKAWTSSTCRPIIEEHEQILAEEEE